MTPEEADEAYDGLRRHARAIAPPGDSAAALKLVDGAALAQLQRDAIVHYVSCGPAVVNLAYRVLKAGTATFVAARFAAGGEPPRELFATRMIALDAALDGAAPAARASALIDRLAGCLAGGRDRLGADAIATDAIATDAIATDAIATDGDADVDVDGGGVGDLLEAAGIAYVIAQLLENPPRPALAGA